MFKLITVVLICLKYNDALIVPQEVPSLLSLVYSTIPQVKKGTDSRFGFGFRLGEHADLQVLVELGPQIETRAIGGSASSSLTNKREIKQQDLKTFNKQLKSEEDPATWLRHWSFDMQSKLKNIKTQIALVDKGQITEDDVLNIGSHSIPVVSEEALQKLKKLYIKN